MSTLATFGLLLAVPFTVVVMVWWISRDWYSDD